MIPLGGANEIGASAYFLSIDGVKILLDCGARLHGEERFPDYERLINEISDYSEIDMIFISHSHFDHVGSFAKITSLAHSANIFCTMDTSKLISAQLLDFGRISDRKESENVKKERYRLAQSVISRIECKPVFKPFEIKGIRVSFFPAGHMPGAVMILLESTNCSVLYSGDFCSHSMYGMNNMNVPDNIHPNTLLINVPNAYKCESEKEESNNRSNKNVGRYLWLKRSIKRTLEERGHVYLCSSSIPKHLDMFLFLKHVFPDIPTVIEPKSRMIFNMLCDMGYQISGENIRNHFDTSSGVSIIVGQDPRKEGITTIIFDMYSLHDTPKDAISFIEKVKPKTVYLLHTVPEKDKSPMCDIVREKDDTISVIQAINGSKYYIERIQGMQYSKLFSDVMEKQLNTANEQLTLMEKKGAAFNFEWASIFGGLMYPEKHPREAYENIQRTFVKKYKMTYDDYLNALRASNLDSIERRQYVLNRVEKGCSLLKKALDGDRNAMEQFTKFTDDLNPRDQKNKKSYFIGKYLVNFIVLIDPDLKDDKYIPIVATFGARYCDKLLRKIRDKLLKEYGIQKNRKTAKDVLQKTEKAIFESSELVRDLDSQNEIEQLKFMNSNYRNSLELVQSMLDELNETIDETAEDAKNAAISSFYTTMNSDVYGNLLDSMEIVSNRLSQIKKERVKIPPIILPLTIFFKQFLRFIKDCGITPIDIIGREFETDADGLEAFTYFGDPFEKNEERKTVVVEKPGWKYGSTIISIPTVREKEREE